MDKAKFERVMGIIGTVTAVLMYVFYINTIRNYLNAAPGTEKDWLQPRPWPVSTVVSGSPMDCLRSAVIGPLQLPMHPVLSLVV